MKPVQNRKQYRWKNNPKERIFWEEFSDVACHLQDKTIIRADFISQITGNQLITDTSISDVMHVIQWLGSPVGQSFLAQVQERIEKEGV